MALPVGQVDNTVAANNQTHEQMGERILQLSKKTNDVAQRNAEANARLNSAQEETERLIPYVKATVTAAGGVLGLAVSRALGASFLWMCVATAGGVIVGHRVSRYFTWL